MAKPITGADEHLVWLERFEELEAKKRRADEDLDIANDRIRDAMCYECTGNAVHLFVCAPVSSIEAQEMADRATIAAARASAELNTHNATLVAMNPTEAKL